MRTILIELFDIDSIGKYACISGSANQAPQSGVVFIDCEFTNVGGNGLGLGTSSYVSGTTTLIGCWIHDCLQGITRQGSNVHYVYMTDCIVQNCTSSGVTGTAVLYKLIKNCTFYGASTPAGTAINMPLSPSGCYGESVKFVENHMPFKKK